MLKVSHVARAYERAAGLTDPALYRLPHPKRSQLIDGLSLIQKAIDESSQTLANALADHRRPLGSILPGVKELLGPSGQEEVEGCTNTGELMTLVVSLMYRYRHGRIMTLTDALDAKLRETDIGEEAPCTALRLPFPAIFMEFGTARNTPYRVPNVATGAHILEGAYASESQWVCPHGSDPVLEALGILPGETCRVIDFAVVGSPVGKAGVLDDALLYFELFLSERDEDASLSAVLERHLQAFNTVLPRLRRYTPMSDTDQSALRQCIIHLVKGLLYLQATNRITTEECPERELRARLGRTGNRKQAKLERRLARVYDRVLVGPVRFEDAVSPVNGRHVATHWRRGHFRRQPFGPGRVDSRLLWIEPVLVNANQIAVPAKDYTVK